MSPKNNSNELKLTRLYNAPVKAVWDAWTDPQKAAHWWGPRGFTITTHSKDLRPGGIWHYTMHGPDGVDYPNKTVYLEIDSMKRLVYDHGGNDERAPLFRVTVVFKDLGHQTQMDMTMAFASAEQAKQSAKFIKTAGGHGTWDRLAEYIAKTKDNRELFIIHRSFEAPIKKVFEMWTNPQHFARWMGPTGVTMKYFEDTIAEGKTTFYSMTYETGITMYGKITYHTIKSPTHLEYTQKFCDEHGEPAKHPFVPVWPDLIRTRIVFADEGDNQTRITMTWEPEGKTTAEEMKVFTGMRTSMNQGWTQSFDKLEEALAPQ